MKDFKSWKEEIAPSVVANDEHLSPEDYQFFHNPIMLDKIQKYINWFAKEINAPNLTTVQKAYVAKHVMQILGVDSSKVYRILNNPELKNLT